MVLKKTKGNPLNNCLSFLINRSLSKLYIGY